MALDLLHERIRKLKNPLIVDFSAKREHIPEHILSEEENFPAAYERFCREILRGLKDTVPGVRFPFGFFALMGADGLERLKKLLREAKTLGYYVVLDAPEILSPWAAEAAAETVFGTDEFPCDALVISPYIGSDALKPFASFCQKGEKDLFAVIRSANKSAAELQDLLTGSRHVYGATAETVSRAGESSLAKCGYSCICGVVGAGSGDMLRQLRMKHNRLFLMVDGLEYPSGNIKNCSSAFDRFGHGAVICAGSSVTAAWRESEGEDYICDAVAAADRIKKNIGRYISIL